MFGVSGQELFLIALAALLLLGPDRIPPLARAFARGYRELTRVRRHVDSTLDELKSDLNLDLDLDAPRMKTPAGRRQPLDQLHAADPGRSGVPAGQPEPLAVPECDDYLGGADTLVCRGERGNPTQTGVSAPPESSID